MHAFRQVVAGLLGVALVACDTASSSHGDDGGAEDSGRADAASDAGVGGSDAGVGGAVSICATPGLPQTMGIASARFGASPLAIEARAELSGPGAAAVTEAKAQGLGGLVWHRDGWVVLSWMGFWDVERGGAAHWIETSTFVHGAVAGDIDGDGDQDLMVLSSAVEGISAERAVVSRLLVFERTPTGLVQRSEARKSGAVVGMPFVFDDIDTDGDLDILTYESGAPIGYINDGAFEFSRAVLGAVIDDYLEYPPIAVALGDRDRDGVQDLLVVLGHGVAFQFVVLSGDGAGGFMPGVRAPGQETSASGVVIGDVTGDGIADVIMRQYQDRDLLHLTASLDATTFAPPVEIEPGGGLLTLQDLDMDGTLDIVTALDNQLFALLARGGNEFEPHPLGIEAAPNVLAFAAEPGTSSSPARVDILYDCSVADGGAQ